MANHPRKISLFLFLEVSLTVNFKQVVSKIPILLVHSKTTSNKGHNEYKRLDRGLQRFKKKNPEKYNALMNKTMDNLNEWEKALKT